MTSENRKTARGNPAARNHRPRGGGGRFLRSAETAERDAEACRLRSAGLTYPQIAAELGYGSSGRAYEGVQRALLSIVQEPAEELRKLELDRLDEMWRAALGVLRAKHIVVQHGKVVMHRQTDGVEAPLEDPGPVLQAVDRLLRIQERRARLLGLDAPKQVEMITLEMIQAEIVRLEAELAARPDDDAEGW